MGLHLPGVLPGSEVSPRARGTFITALRDGGPMHQAPGRASAAGPSRPRGPEATREGAWARPGTPGPLRTPGEASRPSHSSRGHRPLPARAARTPPAGPAAQPAPGAAPCPRAAHPVAGSSFLRGTCVCRRPWPWSPAHPDAHTHRSVLRHVCCGVCEIHEHLGEDAAGNKKNRQPGPGVAGRGVVPATPTSPAKHGEGRAWRERFSDRAATCLHAHAPTHTRTWQTPTHASHAHAPAHTRTWQTPPSNDPTADAEPGASRSPPHAAARRPERLTRTNPAGCPTIPWETELGSPSFHPERK